MVKMVLNKVANRPLYLLLYHANIYLLIPATRKFYPLFSVSIILGKKLKNYLVNEILA
ncbi:MAG: hypothetical protein ACJASU_002309 [Cognaticolwellia sp.]|jgi:hypothetical protein